tara:strand:+ start:10771 stop:11595 length:825 start_codon:yes stop_codon:yes gene_type:complete
MTNILQNLLSILQTSCYVYLSLIILFYFLSNFFIFFPPKPTTFISDLDTHVIDAHKLNVGENQQALKIPPIHSLYYPNPASKYTILFSHGNAEDLGSLQPLLRYFNQKGYSIFAYDYSGYGLNNGKPNEKNTYANITAAYQYLTQTLKVNPKHIILYGRSLGGGPSVELASQYPVGGLILESTFVTAYRIKTRYPIIPFDKYKNIRKISKVQAPIMVIHGEKDSLIPIWHGQALYNKAKQPKTFYAVPNAEHNNLIMVAGEEYWAQLSRFIENI